MHRTTLVAIALVLGLIGAAGQPASAQLMTKPQVANLIVKVENGVDDFRDYLDKRGENARDTAAAAPASGRKKRQPTENQKAAASNKKDDLDDAREISTDRPTGYGASSTLSTSGLRPRSKWSA